MENNSSREDIADGLTFSTHVSDVNDLWSNESRSAASNKEILFFISIGSQSKVADSRLPTILLFKHNVFGFEISMDNSIAR